MPNISIVIKDRKCEITDICFNITDKKIEVYYKVYSKPDRVFCAKEHMVMGRRYRENLHLDELVDIVMTHQAEMKKKSQDRWKDAKLKKLKEMKEKGHE